MAFPTIPTSGASRILSVAQANATSPRTFPSLTGLTKNSGDLLIAIAVAYQTSTGTDAAFSSWGGGFTEFADRATSTTMAIGMAYKWSTGSETGTFTVAQAGTITGHCQLILLSIAGAHASTIPEASTKVNGTSSNATPSALDPSGWAAEDTLWIELIGWGETSTTGSATGISAMSTDFIDTYTAVLSADATGGVEAAVAFRQQNASSQQPDTAFSVDTSNGRHSVMTIAVRPAPAPNTGSASGAIDWAGSATGTTVRSGTGSGSITWAGSATGTTSRTGAATGAIDWAGSATGSSPNKGSASGSIAWAGTTATGASAHSGSSTGAVDWAGTADGITDRSGSASGAVDWAGAADGSTSRSGSAVGAVDWAGSADGATSRTGSASGAVDWAGSATGEAPAGVNSGSASGSITWAGTAAGSSPNQGSAAGAITWAGTADGIAPPVGPNQGSASGSITWAGVATGNNGEAAIRFTGTATWLGPDSVTHWTAPLVIGGYSIPTSTATASASRVTIRVLP
jgi:hypothetical protein